MRRSVCFAIFAALAVSTQAARAQESPRVELLPSSTETESELPCLRLEFMSSALYLASLGGDGSRHLGPEFSFGISIPFELDWSVIVRGRYAVAFDLQTPPGETSDSFWDYDFRTPLGVDIGIRFDHEAIGDGRHALLIGFDIAGSVTYYANRYEHIDPSVGLGLAGALRLGYRLNRFTVSLVVGGRLEGDPIAETVWAGASAGLNFSLAFR